MKILNYKINKLNRYREEAPSMFGRTSEVEWDRKTGYKIIYDDPDNTYDAEEIKEELRMEHAATWDLGMLLTDCLWVIR